MLWIQRFNPGQVKMCLPLQKLSAKGKLLSRLYLYLSSPSRKNRLLWLLSSAPEDLSAFQLFSVHKGFILLLSARNYLLGFGVEIFIMPLLIYVRRPLQYTQRRLYISISWELKWLDVVFLKPFSDIFRTLWNGIKSLSGFAAKRSCNNKDEG